jgi:hypothetical protein
MTSGRALILGMIVLVLGAVGAGFYVLGSPGEQRLLRLDERRVEDLNGIRAGVNAHWRTNQRLPESLDDARQGTALYRDPVSSDPYEYRVLDERSYELCATFDREFTPEEPALAVRLWPHPAGRHCFTLGPEGRP